jgi:hypothetical protein
MEKGLTISRPRRGDGLEVTQITITTGKGRDYVRASVSLDDFARALTGLTEVPCEVEERKYKS